MNQTPRVSRSASEGPQSTEDAWTAGADEPAHYGLPVAPGDPWPLPVPVDGNALRPGHDRTDGSGGPLPGWYAISVGRLHDPEGRFDYFQEHLRPFDHVGYAIRIYHISVDDANRLRAIYGLPLLPGATNLGRMEASSIPVAEPSRP